MATINVLEARGGSLVPPAAQRGYHIFYRDEETNHCPGCGRTHWYIGRLSSGFPQPLPGQAAAARPACARSAFGSAGRAPGARRSPRARRAPFCAR